MEAEKLSDNYIQRQQRLFLAMQAAGLDCFAVNAGPSLIYLTGLHFHLSERPVIALFSPGQPLVIGLPALEVGKVEALPFPVKAFPYGEDPTTWGEVFRQASQAAALAGKRTGAEARNFRLLEVSLLQEALAGLHVRPADAVVATLRTRKDETEVAAMRQAVRIAEGALQATLPHIRTGMTERELAAELTLQILRAGSDPTLPFSPIVAAGPNSANPHAVPGERKLTTGDLLILDWGAGYQGYFSDLTRTFAVGEVESELAKIAEVVWQANLAGQQAVREGVPARQVDAAARQTIEQQGYGQYFIHRTGHGLGIEGHEEPYIHSKNDTLLQSGMTFTIEPGIYLPGRGGVRIEDNMVVRTAEGESLSSLPRELIRVGG